MCIRSGNYFFHSRQRLPRLFHKGQFALSLVQEVLLCIHHRISAAGPSYGSYPVGLSEMPEGSIVAQAVLAADVQHHGKRGVSGKGQVPLSGTAVTLVHG